MEGKFYTGVVCFVAATVISVMSATSAAAADDKEYPNRTLTIITGSGSGGGTDIFARTIALPMRRAFKQDIIVKNVPGAAGAIGMAAVAELPADGYTILALGTDMMVTDAFKRSQYSRNDFIPIARVQQDQSMLWVKTDGPFKSIQDVIEHAKNNPGKQKWGITQPAGFDEVLVSKFAMEAGFQMTTVPFNNAPETHAALLGGHVDVAHEEPGAIIGLYEAGKIRPLVVMSEKRLPKFKDVPTAVELGYDVTIGVWRALFFKKGVDPKMVKVMEEAVKKAMGNSVYQAVAEKRLLDQRDGFLGSEDFKVFLDKEAELYRTILKQLGHIK